MVQEKFEISESELLELLNSMEDEDLDNEASEKASEEALACQREYNRQASAESRQRTKERNLKIQRAAFEQKLIDLNAVIPQKYSQLLISELISKYDAQIQKNKEYVIKRINDLIWARTPKFLRSAFKHAPHAFKRHPGFLYRTEKILNREYTFWINIDGPYYFKQGSESEMLHKFCSKYIKSVDRAISSIYRYDAEKKQEAVDIAIRLAHLKRGTYFELLKAKPEWFQVLYDAIATKKIQAVETQTYVNDLW